LVKNGTPLPVRFLTASQPDSVSEASESEPKGKRSKMGSNGSGLLNRAPRGYCETPNALVVNLGLLTHAELCLALVSCRRGANKPISDELWSEWTGLHPRMKYNAVKGLKKRGCLSVDGKANSARFTFDRDAWTDYVSHAERSKPRTAGRRAVDPKPSQQVDRECRERGCGLLRMRCGETGLTPDPATVDMKPVSYISVLAPVVGSVGDATGTDGTRALAAAASTGLGYSQRSESTPVGSTQVLKPVSKITAVENSESLWILTLAMLRSVFPLVGVAFLSRLLATVCALFAGVTDAELSGAVRLAWNWNRARQKHEGLFLLTVPEALRFLRDGGDARAGDSSVSRGQPKPPFSLDDVRAFIARNGTALRSAGYESIAWALESLDLPALYSDLGAFEERLTAIEVTMIAAVRDGCDETALAELRADLDRDLKPYSGKMTRDQLAMLERQFLERRLLERAKVPRLSLFYL
jgi:hypothetical protein